MHRSALKVQRASRWVVDVGIGVARTCKVLAWSPSIPNLQPRGFGRRSAVPERITTLFDLISLMIPSWITALSSVGMAVAPPLVYADQGISIVRNKDSSGFSRDICAILLFANITRCFFWLGARFQFALLLQSILMIIAQLALLFISLRYRPKTISESYAPSPRPFSFWQWSSYTQYIECLAVIILCSGIIFLIFESSELYISLLGFLALGLESTLPVPQLICNYKRKSLYGFRASTMIGWVGGDAFKTAYFFVQGSSLQFKACAAFQLSIDTAIIAQCLYYGNAPPVRASEREELVLSEE